jgi:hypothetical protein
MQEKPLKDRALKRVLADLRASPANPHDMRHTRKCSAQWLERLRGSQQSDSATLIRDDRDSR